MVCPVSWPMHRIAAAALLLLPAPALAQQPAAEAPRSVTVQPPPSAPPPGFETVVVQPPKGAEPRTFAEAVMAALPRDMKDPTLNFMREADARANAPYRLVMVFHGSVEPPQQNLCAAQQQVEAAQATPEAPPPGTVAAEPTAVTAAFCDGDRPLSQAHTRISGGVDPDQASFRFLVSDVAKQLFPLGFATLPRPGTASGSTLPSR